MRINYIVYGTFPGTGGDRLPRHVVSTALGTARPCATASPPKAIDRGPPRAGISPGMSTPEVFSDTDGGCLPCRVGAFSLSIFRLLRLQGLP